MPEPSDPDFDALKRRARRRLVGAVVLALGAAVFVPMLLESEQKPLGDDVSVRIPPVDDGKFVNQLNAPAAPAAAGSKPPAAAPASKPVVPDGSAGAAAKPADTSPEPQAAAPAPAGESGPAAAGASPTTAAAATAASPATAAPTTPSDNASTNRPGKSLADAEHRVLGTGGGAKAAAPPPQKAAVPNDAKKTSTAKPPEAPAKAATGGSPATYVVQLAAFSDDKGANSLSNRLKKAGYTAYTEPVTTSHGTLWRVRVGPFGTRDDANAARDRLKHEGYSGLVAANPRTT